MMSRLVCPRFQYLSTYCSLRDLKVLSTILLFLFFYFIHSDELLLFNCFFFLLLFPPTATSTAVNISSCWWWDLNWIKKLYTYSLAYSLTLFISSLLLLFYFIYHLSSYKREKRLKSSGVTIVWVRCCRSRSWIESVFFFPDYLVYLRLLCCC